ncbi:MAG: glycoside hydrolase family 2 TIM barrel-domain containing protein [Pyrinomonadaceae bacterium]
MKIISFKIHIFGIFFILMFGTVPQAAPQMSARVRYTINDNWEFYPGQKEGAQTPDPDSEDWIRISLPHTSNLADAFDDEPGYRRGESWYRRELVADPSLRNKRLFLFFEGANQTAEVYVNGIEIGRHVGGFSAFAFDVTESISFEKPNLIAVKIDNKLDKDIPPLDQDFTIFGGIYRDVWLIAAEDVHVKITDHASPGIKVTTPEVSESSARVNVSGTIVNSGAKSQQIEVKNTIFDNQNREISVMTSEIRIGGRSEKTFEQISGIIRNPMLWSPDDPNLYRIRTEIISAGKTIDEIENPLGFRWFRFDANEGFFLNDKHLKLRGTNRHQDRKGFGIAVPDEIQVRDLEIIKENGFNFLRLAHYPQDPSVLEAADRLGILIWEEIPIVNLITISEAFSENSKTMLLDMIRQHRNHPSVIMWGYMNEVFLRSPKTAADLTQTLKLAKELEAICKTEDPDRATAIAFDYGERENYYQAGITAITDVVGWNLYFGWYHDTFEDFGKFIDEQHRRLPGKPLMISEYGGNADQRLHSSQPKRFDSTIEWQRMFHESYLKQINERKYLSGSAVWNQFDFSSEFRGETIPHLNQKGLYDYDRRPKDISYFYRSNFSREPVVHIAVRDWKYRSGSPKHTIDVYTNFPEAELFQNGISLGTKAAANNKVSWEVNLSEGKTFFSARAYGGNQNIAADSAEVFYTDTSKAFDNSFKEIAVNAGSNADFTDRSETVWTADKRYESGGWGFFGADAKEISTLRNALGSPDDPLFQTMQEGLSGFRFDVPAGKYEIELRFVEPKFKEAGMRVFDVEINGVMIFKSFDPAKESGFMRALTKKTIVSTKDGGGINIEFSAVKDNPILSGVRIRKIF